MEKKGQLEKLKYGRNRSIQAPLKQRKEKYVQKNDEKFASWGH